jgi:hypothetical protein
MGADLLSQSDQQKKIALKVASLHSKYDPKLTDLYLVLPPTESYAIEQQQKHKNLLPAIFQKLPSSFL